MHRISAVSLFALAAVMALPPRPLAAQGDSTGLRGEMLRDLATLERKVVSLAEAMTAEQYGWTPMEGVRTVGQVYMHIAATNYFFPTLVGVAAPPSTSITSSGQSAEAFETAGGTKDEIVAKLKDSFRHLKTTIEQTSDLDRSVNVDRQRVTVRMVWLATITHIHEHLGQAIAYARSNHVVPPWSQ